MIMVHVHVDFTGSPRRIAAGGRARGEPDDRATLVFGDQEASPDPAALADGLGAPLVRRGVAFVQDAGPAVCGELRCPGPATALPDAGGDLAAVYLQPGLTCLTLRRPSHRGIACCRTEAVPEVLERDAGWIFDCVLEGSRGITSAAAHMCLSETER